jgi:DNA-binding LytR/AlgR family response regulator
MNKINILIIEDDVVIAHHIKSALEESGHQIIGIARSHAEAIVALERQTPELILIDILLKHSALDGVEIAHEIAKNYMIPFVFLTANEETPTFERAKATNPAAYLIKPFRNQELVFQVELAYNHYLVNKGLENNPSRAENVYLSYDNGYQKIAKNDVLFLKANGSYVDVYVKSLKTPYLFTMNMGHLFQYFTTPNFYQISRSYIVNLDYLDWFDAEFLTLNHYEEKIKLPNNKQVDLKKRLAIIKSPQKV